jgi:L-ascorbate metabolism protein UlaG (beta-lactamase superfamily)
MKRRQVLRFGRAGLLTALGMGLAVELNPAQAQSGSPLSVRWLGHMSFLFTGGGQRVLVNPFRPIGCTAKYRAPKVPADLVLISSQLLDEGVVDGLPNNPRLLYEPGVYEVGGLQIQGISTDHDRLGGRRFGRNVAWRWKQGGVNILHLGGAAAPITLEQKILMGRPDVLLIPVGGGAKAYNPQEAKQAIQALNPKLVIPMQYRTQAADPAACDIVALDEFLSAMEGTPVRRVNGDSRTIRPSDLPEKTPTIEVFSYSFS